jgi:hypothetical protein
MRKRRSSHQADSLELLLDTICNVFGGIILMAILVVIQTQSSSGRIQGAIPEQQADILEKRKLEYDLHSRQQRLEQLKDQEKSLKTVFDQNASPDTEKLITSREKFQLAIKGGMSLQKKSQVQLETIQDDLRNSEKSLSKINLEIMDKKKEADELTSQVKKKSQTISRKVRLPHQQGEIKFTPRYYVIKGRKAFTLEEVYWFGETHRSGDCIVKPLSGEKALVTPIDEQGYPIPPDDNENYQEFLSSMRGCSPTTTSMVFFVYGDSDSFRSFQKIKNYVLGRKYEYSVSPYDPQEGLIVVRGTPSAE